ncbi:hypothetical protein [Peribacillus kribbensis]|uniref:hypothetical protein n=1 Tax=Peribacillus kribbensis TaxID=356658 RepID=UPI0004298B7B|nr:hypothetical protein [Peribacillus kribbensis]
MWDSILELDHHVFRMAILLGLLLTIVLPYAALYFSYKLDKKLDSCPTVSLHEQGISAIKLKISLCKCFITQIISFIRRKLDPGDSEEPISLLVSS